VHEEVLEDGTRIQVITLADGTVVRKVIHDEYQLEAKAEAIEQQKLAIQAAEQELLREQEVLNEMIKEKERLMTKEEFRPPGIKGKVKRRMIDENGNEIWVDVDLEHEDFDDNMSV